jgi:ubiquinone/menaquinone biosynthesis C-methylase UbiE
MQETEFDKFADEYRNTHAKNIGASGETPEFFAEYKINDLAERIGARAGDALRILDFGAGVGTSAPWFKKYFPASTLTCLDVSRKSLKIGAQRHADLARFVHFDGNTLPFEDGSFDVAFTACVFHHIDHAEHDRLLAEIHRCLAPGGRFIVFEHNPYNPLTVRAVNTCEFDENAVLLKPGKLVRQMRQAGFDHVERHYRIFFPHAARALRPAERLLRWLPLGAQYYVTGSRRAAD